MMSGEFSHLFQIWHFGSSKPGLFGRAKIANASAFGFMKASTRPIRVGVQGFFSQRIHVRITSEQPHFKQAENLEYTGDIVVSSGGTSSEAIDAGREARILVAIRALSSLLTSSEKSAAAT